MEPNQNNFPNSQSEDNNTNRFNNPNINESNFSLKQNIIEKKPEYPKSKLEVKSENSSLFQNLENYKASESNSSGIYQKNKEENEKTSSKEENEKKSDKKENEKISSKEEKENNLSQNFHLSQNINDLKIQLKSTKDYLSQKLDLQNKLSVLNTKLLYRQSQILLNQNSNLEKIVSLLEKK